MTKIDVDLRGQPVEIAPGASFWTPGLFCSGASRSDPFLGSVANARDQYVPKLELFRRGFDLPRRGIAHVRNRLSEHRIVPRVGAAGIAY